MKIGTLLYHPKYGVIKLTRQKYSPVKNRLVWYAKDESGRERELSGQEVEMDDKEVERYEMIQGRDGIDGETPVKGKDYFTQQEIEDFKRKVTPKKGKDYFDGLKGEKGDTPVKGKDYFTQSDIKEIASKATPIKGVHYKDGEKGEKGDKPKHKWEGTRLLFEKPDGTWGRAVDLKGSNGFNGGGGGGSFNAQVGVSSADHQPGFLTEKLIAGSGVTLTSSGNLNEQITISASGGSSQNMYVTVGFDSSCDYICDGTADDVQIQEAIDSLTGGGTILLRQGTYEITAPIEIEADGIIIKGEGIATILNNVQTDYETGHCFYSATRDYPTVPTTKYCRIEDIKITQLDTSGDAMNFSYLGVFSQFKNIVIDGGYRGVNVSFMWESTFENVSVANTVDSGWYLINNCSQLTILNCQAFYCGNHGLYSSGGYCWSVIGFDAEQNTGWGVYLSYGSQKVFSSTYFENNSEGDFYRGSGTTGSIDIIGSAHFYSPIGIKCVYGNTSIVDPSFDDSVDSFVEIDSTVASVYLKTLSSYKTKITNNAQSKTRELFDSSDGETRIKSLNKTTASITEGNLDISTEDEGAIDVGASITLGGYSNVAKTLKRVFASVEGRKESDVDENSSGYLSLKVNKNGTLTERATLDSEGKLFVYDGVNINAGKSYEINGSAITTANVADSTDARYCTDAEKTVIGNTSNTNTGDNTVCTSGTATTAETLATARTIGGVSFDGSANIDLPGVNTAGNQDTTGNAATATTATDTASKTGTGSTYVTNTSPTLVTPLLGTPTSGVLTNCTGTASGLTAGTVTNATLTTALTVNTGTVTLTGNVANSSVLTIGAGAVSVSGSNTGDQNDHGTLDGLSDDDHSQYALLAGRSGGQTIIGGTGSGENLELLSTSNATKGVVSIGDVASDKKTFFDVTNSQLKVGLKGTGTGDPVARLEVRGGTDTSDLCIHASTDGTGKSAELSFYVSTGELAPFNNRSAEIKATRTATSGIDLAIYQSDGTTNRETFRFLASTGSLGVGVTAPTASLHIKAGSATAGTSPIKLTSGTLNTTPEAGAIEYLSGDYYVTDATPTRHKLLHDGNGLALVGGTMTGAIETADHGTATDPEAVSVVYGTSETPPTASNTPIGTLYLQYVA